MIKKIEVFTVICDECKLNFYDGSQYCGWSDEGYVEDDCDEAGWLKKDDKHYCPECAEKLRLWDDE